MKTNRFLVTAVFALSVFACSTLSAKNNLLHDNIENGSLSSIEAALDKGIEIDSVDNNGDTAVLLAARYGRIDVLRLLVERGANVNVLDSKKRDVLNIAITTGAVEIVSMLLKAGAPTNRINRIGWTALLEVAILGDGSEDYITIAQMLIDAGADKTIADKEGVTPYQHAKSRGHDALALVLKH